LVTLDHSNLVIFPGMPRAGTTTLFAWLARHPQIFAPWRKEPTYFSQNFSRGEAWYRRFYADMKPGQIGIDASTEYFVNPLAPGRMIAFDPKLRAVLVVRDPVDWVISLYARIRRVSGTGSFESFVEGFRYSRGGRGLWVDMGAGYVIRQTDLFRHAFQRNILLIDFHLMASDPIALLTAIERFAGLPAHFAASGVESLKLNTRNERAMGPAEWLMTREPVLGILGSIVPTRVMAGLRQRYERGMATTEDDKPRETPAQRVLAEKVFAEDRRVIRGIFAEAPIVLGDGQAFAPPDRSHV
jgi:hypothetical protein